MEKRTGLILGITGGVACGKSSAAAMLAKTLSAEQVNTDDMAKRLMEDDADLRHAIEAHISPLAYGEDAHLDRDWLRQAIFADPSIRERLNAIVHPCVRKAWSAKVADARHRNSHMLVEIPLLYEVDAAPMFDEIVVVGASSATQVRRLVELRGLSEDVARKILASQLDLLDKLALAERVLWNDSDLVTLKRQADYLAAIFLKPSI